MKISDIFESKTKRKDKIPMSVPRNYVAKNSKTSGAGSHTSKEYSRKEKHKNKPKDED